MLNRTSTGGLLPAAAMILALVAAPAALACQAEPNFQAWLQGVKRQALSEGISERAIDSAFARVGFDQSVVNKDRAQGVFTQDFLTFSSRMVSQDRLDRGRRNLSKYDSTFDRIEAEFGVPREVLTAFWGLETDFGLNVGSGNTLASLATLAYDCRRPDLFRHQFLSAIRIIDRGDLSAQEMRGPWAGEIGQVQFLPAHYVDFGVDYDGDGNINLLDSSADSLASAANYLRHLGWRAGEPWLREVTTPADLPWAEADIAIKHPVSQWAAWGVRLRDGSALPAGDPPASLHLPMGRNGPAFLAYHNFDVYLVWNESLIYSTTAAYLATRYAGAPKVSPGRGADVLSAAQVTQVQQLLEARGYDVGGADGVIGAKTRTAVKDAQIRLGLPADSFPSPLLLQALR